MPSSYSSSSSSVEIIGATSPRSASALATDATTIDKRSHVAAERYPSSLRSQRDINDLIRKHGIPKAYTARLADGRRACTPPPDQRTVCMYAHALEAGLRLPLHSFISDVLTHFGLAPSQLAPNGWRILLAFLVLCHDTGVPSSVAVFRNFFSLIRNKHTGWYFFRVAKGAGALFTGRVKYDTRWQHKFFFLTSPKPWACPVRWGEPPPSPTDQVLTDEQAKSVKKLLEAQGVPLDLRTYLCVANLAAAFSSNLAGQGTDQSANKALAPASGTDMVKTEPGNHAPALSGKKRNREEPSSNDGLVRAEHVLREKSVASSHLTAAHLSTRFETNLAAATPPQPQHSIRPAGGKGMDQSPKEPEPNGSTLPLQSSGKKMQQDDATNSVGGLSRSRLNTLPADHSCSATCTCTPPGFDPMPRYLPVPDAHDINGAIRDAAPKELKHKLAAEKPSDDVSPSTDEAMLQTVNSLSSYALELKRKLEKLQAEHTAELKKKDAEVAALWGQLKQGKAGNAEFAATLQQVMVSEDLVRRRAEQALDGYQRFKSTPRRT